MISLAMTLVNTGFVLCAVKTRYIRAVVFSLEKDTNRQFSFINQ